MEIFTEDNSEIIKDWCELCLKHQLYVSGRMAEEWFQDPGNMVRMSLLDHKSLPIGWSMLYKAAEPYWEFKPVLGVYVTPKWRKKGLATKLINAIMDGVDFPIYVDNRIKIFRTLPILSKERMDAIALQNPSGV